MLHVHAGDDGDTFVASIHKQHPSGVGYRKEEPWLLLRVSGRIERFASQHEAREEAVKSWPRARFARN